jgi:hypothetical protein
MLIDGTGRQQKEIAMAKPKSNPNSFKKGRQKTGGRKSAPLKRAEDYNEFVTNVFCALKLIDVIEEMILVMDIVDLVLELSRLRRFKTLA